MKKFLAIVLLCSFLIVGNAQEKAYEEPTIIYSNQNTLGIYATPLGSGIRGDLGKFQGVERLKMWSLEIGKLKHPKEFKAFIPRGNGNKPFVLSKVNSFNTIRVSRSRQKNLSEKLRKGAVQVSVKYGVGATIGILKPIYVEIPAVSTESPTRRIERYDPSNVDHALSNINGRASFINGLNEIRFKPGFNFKVGFVFEYSSVKENVKALEAGVLVDVFSEKIQILSEESVNKQFFAALYLQFHLGRKFVKR